MKPPISQAAGPVKCSAIESGEVHQTAPATSSGADNKRSPFSGAHHLAKVTAGVAAQHPSLLAVPLVLFCVFISVGVWASVKAEHAAERQLRKQAHLLALPIADRLQLQFSSPANTLYTVSLLARATPYYPDLVLALDRVAADVMKTGKVIAIGLAPLGVLTHAYPPTFAAVVRNESLVNPDLMLGLFADITPGLSNLGAGMSAAEWVPQPQIHSAFQMGNIPVSLLTIPVLVPLGTDVGFNRSTPITHCLFCTDPMATQALWGLAVVAISLVDALNIDPKDPQVQLLSSGKYDFDIGISPQIDRGGYHSITIASSPQAPSVPECIRNSLVIADWVLCIAPTAGWRQSWLSPVIAGIVLLTTLVAVLVFLMMLSRLRHQMLLRTLVPEQVLKQMQQNPTFLKAPAAKPVLQAGTAADRILSLMDELLSGHEPDQTSLLLIRNAVSRSQNIYLPLDFGQDLKALAFDNDVTAALMRQLGTSAHLTAFNDVRSSPTSVDSLFLRQLSITSTAGSPNHLGSFATLTGGLVAILGASRAERPVVHLPMRDPQLDRAGSAFTPHALTGENALQRQSAGESAASSLIRSAAGLEPTSISRLGTISAVKPSGAEAAAASAAMTGSARGAASTSASRRQSIESVTHGTAQNAARRLSLEALGGSQAAAQPGTPYSLQAFGTVSGRQSLEVEGSLTPEIPVPRPLMDQVETLLCAASSDFHFDAFALADATHGRPLSALAFYLFHTSGLVSRFKLQGGVLARFLTICEDGYRPNPYHNAMHAADVLQTYHVILTKGGMVPGYADPLTLMACYLAAVVHDFEHVGLTNDFLVNSSDTLAILYNDRTPMENHHVAATFSLLRQPECAFLAHLPKGDTDHIRKLVIDLVLGTDMKQHFSIISQFLAVHRVAPGLTGGDAGSCSSLNAPDAASLSRHPSCTPDNDIATTMESGVRGKPASHIPLDDAERLLSLQIALKCADLGHICESLQVHLRWVGLLETEFFAQGDREKELGLPISPLFDRTKPGVTKSQVGFFSFVVLPLFQAVTRVFPGVRPALESTQANFEYWEAEPRLSK